jgi:hypothetical protein
VLPNENTEAQWAAIRQLMGGINRKLFEKLGHCVCTGPFRGMIVTDRPNWNDGNCGTKLLGCYEHELWPALELAISRKPSAVINVGAAEGYYAVGLKLRMPEVPVIACDINAVSLEQCAQMAALNGVSIETHIGCKTPEELSFGFTGALYVMDCESDELHLLDPLRCTDLYSADIIVECHDHLWPISHPIAMRFRHSHEVDVIDSELPLYREYEKILAPWPIGLKLSVVTEKRPIPTVYLAMMAKRRQ